MQSIPFTQTTRDRGRILASRARIGARAQWARYFSIRGSMGALLVRVGAVAVALVTLAAGAPATPLQAPQERPVFRAGANVVRVDVTVTNTRGEPANDLTRDDFALTEDGAAQTIDSFELVHVTGQPTDDRALE